MSSGPLARYGVNVGPMVITWALRFLQGRLETWTGRALSKAHREQTKQAKKQRREHETPEEREARRAARRARKAAREEQKQQQEAAPQPSTQQDQVDDDNGFPALDEHLDHREPSVDEKRSAAASAAEARSRQELHNDSYTALDELD